MGERQLTNDHMIAFETELYNDEKSGNTIEKYKRDISRFVLFARGRAVNKPLVLAYKTSLEKDYTPASANSMLAALNSLFRFLGWYDCCVKQFKVQRKTYCAEDTELSKGEYLALVRAARERKNERLSLLIQTLCSTGIRVSEAQYITVEAVKRGEAVISCKGKIRKIFIVSALRNKLLRYAKARRIASGTIFVTKNGKPMDRSNIWREMKALCESAGVSPKKVFPHNLRHLFARTFYGIERDIAKLADVLGHSNVNTTRIYIISTGTEHRRCMERMRLLL